MMTQPRLCSTLLLPEEYISLFIPKMVSFIVLGEVHLAMHHDGRHISLIGAVLRE